MMHSSHAIAKPSAPALSLARQACHEAHRTTKAEGPRLENSTVYSMIDLSQLLRLSDLALVQCTQAIVLAHVDMAGQSTKAPLAHHQQPGKLLET